MRKYAVSFVTFLLFIFGLLIIFNNGRLFLNNFPLRQQWSVNLKEKIQGLSTNGDQIIFARTMRKLSAINVSSGKILWEHSLTRQAISEPAIEYKGIVYVADSKSILAFDQVNGREIWSVPAPTSVAKVKSVSKDVVAVESGPYIYTYSVTDGSLLWAHPACRYGGVQAYVDNFLVYIPCINRISAMDALSGEMAWEEEIPYTVTEVAYQDGVMYYSPERNSVSAYNLRDRKRIWETFFQGEGYRQFKIYGDKVYVIGSDKVCALPIATGAQMWCIDLKESQNPTVIGNSLYVFNGYQNSISEFNISSGQKIGDLTVRNLKFFIIRRELMLSVEDILVFGSDNRVFGYKE